MGLPAGLLKERVTIETEARTPNGQGGFTTFWHANVTVSAEIVGMSDNEALRASIERAATQYRVMIRKTASVRVTAANRLRWNGEVMSINAAMPHPKYPKEALLLLCETAAAG